jgi:hypothetical protein
MDWNPDLIHKQLFKDGIGKTRIISIPGVPFHENGNYRLDGAFLHSFIKPVSQIHKETAVAPVA